MKPEERLEARRLRSENGLSMKAIARRLGVSVSSVSLWTRDIELTPEQITARDRVDRRSPQRRRGTAQRALRARAQRLAAQEDGRNRARRADPLHAAGCMLYWAEGTKHRNTLAFSNSDVDMQRLFVRFLRQCYEVPDEKILLTVNCHLTNGLSLQTIETWWLTQLELPRSVLRKASVNSVSRASRFRRNTLLYGTAKVVVHSTFIAQSIYGAIQELGGFQRDAWLDCAPPGDVVASG